MDDNVPFGRFGMLGRSKSAKTSWWMNLNREEFNEAAKQESARMNQTFRGDNGYNRVIATNYGKV